FVSGTAAAKPRTTVAARVVRPRARLADRTRGKSRMKTFRRAALFTGALVSVVSLAACGKDSSSSPTTPTTPLTGYTIVIDSVSQNQSAVVGSTVTIGFRVMNATVTAGIPNQTV